MSFFQRRLFHLQKSTSEISALLCFLTSALEALHQVHLQIRLPPKPPSCKRYRLGYTMFIKKKAAYFTVFAANDAILAQPVLRAIKVTVRNIRSNMAPSSVQLPREGSGTKSMAESKMASCSLLKCTT